jgi:hypothetical protein
MYFRIEIHFFIYLSNVFQGTGSGVEIIVNEPYTDGPGGSGQFTRKIYHIGSHLVNNKAYYNLNQEAESSLN